MATPEQIQAVQDAYFAINREELNEITATAIADAIANNTTTFAAFVSAQIEGVRSTTAAAVAISAFVTGSTPTAEKLTALKVEADLQVASYAAMGVGNPALGAFEAFGKGFAETAEFAAKYGSVNGVEFINAVYSGVYGKLPSADALANLTSQLAYFNNLYSTAVPPLANAAELAKGAVLGQIVGYAFVTDASGASILDDQVAAFLSAAANGDDAVFGAPLAPVGNPGQVFTLTEGADTIQGQPGNLIGSNGTVDITGDDIIVASENSTGGNITNTLGAGDNINGGAGFDTLSVINSQNVILIPSIQSVERVEVQTVGAVVSEINMLNAVGTTEVANFRSTGAVQFTDVQNEVAIEVQRSTTGIQVGFAADAVTDGSLSLRAIDGDGTFDIDLGGNDLTSIDLASTGITDNDVNTVTIDLGNNGSALETLNVEGDSAAYIDGDLDALTAILITSTGDTTVDLDGGDGGFASNNQDFTFTGGAGDDTLIVTAANFNEDDTVDGGGGTDTIEVRYNGSGDQANLNTVDADGLPTNDVVLAVNNSTSIESLVIDVYTDAVADGAPGAEDINLDASLFTTVKNFTFDDSNEDGGAGDLELAGDITVTEVAADNTFVIATNLNATGSFTSAAADGTLNLALAGDVTTLEANDFATVNLALANEDAISDIGTFNVSADTTVLVTGAADEFNVALFNGEDAVLNASGLTTTASAVNGTENNFVGGAGSQTIIGTAQDDIIDGDNVTNGTPQQTIVDLTNAAVNEGDTYTITINGETVQYVAQAGDGQLIVENALANAIANNANLQAQGISVVNPPGNTFTVVGAPDGSAFTFAGTADNAVLTREQVTVDFGGASFDGRTVGGVAEGDQISISVNGQLITTAPFSGALTGTAISPDVAAQTTAAAISANGTLAAAGIAATAVNGVLTIFGPNNGADLSVILGGDGGQGVIEAAPRADIEGVYFANTVAGSVISFSVQGNDFQFVSDGNEDTDAQTVVNLITNAGIAGISAVIDVEGADETVQDIAIITSSSGTDVALTVTVTGGGTRTIIEAEGADLSTDAILGPVARAGDSVTDNALGAPTQTVEGNPAGANPNADSDISFQNTAGIPGVGAAADVLTGGGGIDTFVVRAGAVTAAGADTITDFVAAAALAASDKIDFEVTAIAGTATNYSEGPVAGFGTFAGALTQAQSDFGANGALVYSAQQVGADVYIFTDNDAFGNGGVVDVVKLSGVTLEQLTNSGNFIIA